MDIPDLVRQALGDEEIQAGVSLGDEDAVCLTPTRTLVYNGEGLLSDERVSEYPHDVEQIYRKTGRRKTKFVLEYIDGQRSFTVPANRGERVLELLLEGVLRLESVIGPRESLVGVYLFSELTLILAEGRLVKHVGEPVWNEDYESLSFDDVTGLEFERASVATSVVLSIDGRPQRVKVPNDEAPLVRQDLENALFAYHDVSSLEELNAAVDDGSGETEAGGSGGDDFSFGSGIDPLVTDHEDDVQEPLGGNPDEAFAEDAFAEETLPDDAGPTAESESTAAADGTANGSADGTADGSAGAEPERGATSTGAGHDTTSAGTGRDTTSTGTGNDGESRTVESTGKAADAGGRGKGGNDPTGTESGGSESAGSESASAGSGSVESATSAGSASSGSESARPKSGESNSSGSGSGAAGHTPADASSTGPGPADSGSPVAGDAEPADGDGASIDGSPDAGATSDAASQARSTGAGPADGDGIASENDDRGTTGESDSSTAPNAARSTSPDGPSGDETAVLADRLEELTDAVDRQNELLKRHHRAIRQLAEEIQSE